MQSRIVVNSTETRERMIAKGLSPELCREFLKESVSMERSLFETLKPTLSEDQRQKRRLYVIQAELLLGIISDACIDQSLP